MIILFLFYLINFFYFYPYQILYFNLFHFEGVLEVGGYWWFAIEYCPLLTYLSQGLQQIILITPDVTSNSVSTSSMTSTHTIQRVWGCWREGTRIPGGLGFIQFLDEGLEIIYSDGSCGLMDVLHCRLIMETHNKAPFLQYCKRLLDRLEVPLYTSWMAWGCVDLPGHS